jgi:hypothetical protein
VKDSSYLHDVCGQEGENGVCSSASAVLYPIAKIRIYIGWIFRRSFCGLRPFSEKEKFGVQRGRHITGKVILRGKFQGFVFRYYYTEELVFIWARKFYIKEKTYYNCFVLF